VYDSDGVRRNVVTRTVLERPKDRSPKLETVTTLDVIILPTSSSSFIGAVMQNYSECLMLWVCLLCLMLMDCTYLIS